MAGSKKFKVTLPDGTAVYHKVYDSGSNKALVIHVKEVLSLIKRDKNTTTIVRGPS